MNRWLLAIAGVGLSSLALAAGPAKPGDPPKKNEPVAEAEQGEGVSLTIYNQNFVVVKERRQLELKEGRATVRFRDVAASIVPESVQFSALRSADLARVAEQNYEFDLVSADKLLNKYIDRDIGIVTRDGEVIKGKLLNFDEQQLVLRTTAGIDVVPRGNNVKDVQFSALPGGLLTRPTLVWQLDSKNTGKELVKVAYRADRMNWRVDYRARVNQAGDKLDLAGWVTITNDTGAYFKDAQIKLMAGDVHVVEEGKPELGMPPPGRGGAAMRKPAAQFGEKSFAEYHLYELGRKTSVKERETKQIELLDVESIPVTRKYSLPAGANRVAVILEFKNDDKVVQGLGIPMPKGPIRVFQHDQDGEQEFVGTDNIDHTPKKEMVKVRLGNAFDLAGERKATAQRNGPGFNEQDWEIRLRNHKTEAVTIDVVEAINGQSNWAMLKQSHPHTRPDVNTLVFPVELKANTEAIVTYSIRYNW